MKFKHKSERRGYGSRREVGGDQAQRALGSEADGLTAAAYVQRKGTVTSDLYLAGLGGLFGALGGLVARSATSQSSEA